MKSTINRSHKYYSLAFKLMGLVQIERDELT